jgi:tetrapyrrole methylase family protein/MazG family protein
MLNAMRPFKRVDKSIAFLLKDIETNIHLVAPQTLKVSKTMNEKNPSSTPFSQLVDIMATLRSPEGCAWDQEQTLETLRAYLLEECHELLEVMDGSAFDAHKEELGDVLLQIVFQSQIRSEAGSFDISDVITTLNEKLIRRHPHVFGDDKVDSAEAAYENWEKIKAQERKAKGGAQKSRFSGIPKSLPGLLKAFRVGEKAATVGFDWPDAQAAGQKIQEEWLEIAACIKAGESKQRLEEEIGDLLFAVANFARHHRIEPEKALGVALEKFIKRFRSLEALNEPSGRDLSELNIDQLETLWQKAKSPEA